MSLDPPGPVDRAPLHGRMLAVCRVHAVVTDAGPAGSTAIDKRPVTGPVAVGRLGLTGDVQRDVERHGGLDKALYAYGESAALTWAAHLGAPIPPGLFGENLRVGGLDVDAAVVGERWQVGEPGFGPLLEVTGPRMPCPTFARFVQARLPEGTDVTNWIRRFNAAGRPGAYLRVVETGAMTAGDAVAVVLRPGHGVTVSALALGLESPAAHARALLAL